MVGDMNAVGFRGDGGAAEEGNVVVVVGAEIVEREVLGDVDWGAGGDD